MLWGTGGDFFREVCTKGDNGPMQRYALDGIPETVQGARRAQRANPKTEGTGSVGETGPPWRQTVRVDLPPTLAA